MKVAADAILTRLEEAAAAQGLALRGAFHCEHGDGVPAGLAGAPVGTLVLLGWIGGRQWPFFSRSREAADGAPHPLDRWSKRVVGTLAEEFDASPFYPFGGPPYLPFQRWAERGDDVFASPLGIYVHPDHGLWHSYRGALGFRERLELPERLPRAHPCETCETKPCLTACPVSAFRPGHYDVDRCAAHVKSVKGVACFTGGCLARRACWVAPELAYGPEEAGFYMRAFVAAH